MDSGDQTPLQEEQDSFIKNKLLAWVCLFIYAIPPPITLGQVFSGRQRGGKS